MPGQNRNRDTKKYLDNGVSNVDDKWKNLGVLSVFGHAIEESLFIMLQSLFIMLKSQFILLKSLFIILKSLVVVLKYLLRMLIHMKMTITLTPQQSLVERTDQLSTELQPYHRHLKHTLEWFLDLCVVLFWEI